MEVKQWMAAIIVLLICVSPAAAQDHNWVTNFLDRYVIPRLDPSATLVPAPNDQYLRSRLRDGTLPLTLDDLIRLLLQSSVDVTVDRFVPLQNEYVIGVNYSPFEPYLNISASAGRTTTPSSSQLAGAAALSTLSGSYQIGINQNLATGTSYSATIGMARNSSNNAFSFFNPYYSGVSTYTISQQLLQNRGRLVNLKGVLVAKNNKKLSDLQFEGQVINIVSNAENTYWNLVLADRQVEVASRALGLAQKLVHDDDIQIRIGTLAPNGKIQAESNVAQREYQTVQTTYQREQIQEQLKRLITNAPDPAMVFSKLNPITPRPEPKDEDLLPLEEAVKFALENRVELREDDVVLENNDLDVLHTKNYLLPTLTVGATYSIYGIGGVQHQVNSSLGDTTPVITSQGGLGDAFNQLFGFGYRGYSLGFNLQVPLTNKPWQADYARAVTTKRNNVTQKEQDAQNIVVQVRVADSQVRMTRAQITAAQKVHEKATQTLDADTKLFQLGTLQSPQLQLIQDQSNLITAETNEIQAYISYAQAMIGYNQALGRTLQWHNIQIEKELTAGSHADPIAPSGTTRPSGH